jgi:TolB protein
MRPIHARRPGISAALAAAITLTLCACGGDNALAPDWESPSTQSVAAADDQTPIGALTTSPRIIFGSYRIADHLDLYRMDPAGSDVVRLTSYSGDESYPAVSWDHKRIAFIRRRVDANNESRDDIYLMNVDGTGRRWARSITTPYGLGYPSWSPDGTRLVVSVHIGGDPYVATLTLATGALDLVFTTEGVATGRQCSYHPDGKSIICVDPSGTRIRQSYIGGDNYDLVNLSTPVGHPSFSPDGKQFVYDRVLAGTNNTEIFVQNRATAAAKRLTFNSALDSDATWSPDGTRIAFMSRRSGQSQIWSVSATGGTATRITHTSTAEVGPSWSH